MKQTNNAIKFLMAQYRAIFQNAYFKGLATAAVVTMGLAAGQAQAATPAIGDLVSGTSTWGETAATVNAAAGKNTWNAELTVNDKTNSITADSGSASALEGSGSLTIASKTGGTADLSLVANKDLTVAINEVNVNKGSLTLKQAATGDATLSASTINIGDGSSANNTATLTVGDKTIADKAATLGNAKSTIVLKKGGTLALDGKAADKSVVTGKFSGTGGDLKFTTSGGTVSAYGSLADVNLSIASDATANITIAADDDPTDGVAKDTLNISSGKIVLSSNNTSTNTSGGILAISGGHVNLGSEVELTTSGDNTKMSNISIGGGSVGAKLTVSKEQLSTYLEGTKASVTLAKTGSITLSNDAATQVDLSKFKFNATAAAQSIDVGAAATIEGKNILLSHELTQDGAANGTAAGVTANLTISADKLTLGSADFDSSKKAIGAKLQAKDLVLEAGSKDAFTVQDSITLSSTLDDGFEGKKAKVKVGTGTITGDAINLNLANASDTITVAAGNYETAGQDITLTKGTLKVSSETPTYQSSSDVVESSLTVKGGNLSLAAKDGLLEVTGKKATLDLSNAGTITLTGDPTDEFFSATAAKGGTLVLNPTQVTQIAKPSVGTNNKASSIKISELGTLKIAGDLEIPGTLLSGGNPSTVPTAPKIFFDNNTGSADADKGGNLVVTGTLTLDGADSTAINISDKGNIKTPNLYLKPTTTDAETKLGDGNYTVFNSLDSDKSIDAQTTSVINLGQLDYVNGKNDDAGYVAVHGEDQSIDADLKLSAGTLNVVAGDWTANGELSTDATGKINIGKSGKPLDENDNAIVTSLTANKKLTATASAITVESNGTLTANELVANATAAITTSGDVVINGKSGTDSNNKPTYGVTLGTGAIAVNDGGSLTFTGAAMEGFKFSGDSLLNSGYIAGAVTTELGAEVNLNYTEEDTLTKKQLDALTAVFAENGKIDGIVNLGAGVIEGLEAENQTITWDEAKEYVDYLPGITTDNLKEAQLTGVANTVDNLTGHFGSIKTDNTFASGDSVTFNKKGGLYNAKVVGESGNKYFIVNDKNESLGVEVAQKGYFTLGGEGIVDSVKLGANSTLVVNKGFNDVEGNVTVSNTLAGEASSTLEVKSGTLNVVGTKTKGLSVGTLNTSEGTSLNANILELTGTAAGSLSKVMGNVTVQVEESAKGNASTSIGAGGAIFGGKENKFAGSFTAAGDVEFTNGGTTTIALTKSKVAAFNDDLFVNGNAKVVVNGDASIKNKSKISENGQLVVDGKLSLDSNNSLLLVGSNDIDDKSAGYLQANEFVLSKGTLMLDPDYNSPSSVALITKFEDTGNSSFSGDAGYADGNLIVGQNSALFVGVDAKEEGLASAKEFLSQYQKANGALDVENKGYGAIAYVNDKVAISKDGFLLVDTQATSAKLLNDDGDLTTEFANYKKTVGAVTPNAYLGKNTALVISDNILEDGAAVHFDTTNAAIHVADSSARVLLDGNGFTNGNREFTLFTDKGNSQTDTNGVMIVGKDLRVETVNGLMFLTYQAGKETTAKELQLDTERAKTIFSDASAPMKNFLVGFAAQDKNWQALGTDDYKKDLVVGAQGPDEKYFTIDTSGKITGIDTTVNGNPVTADQVSKYVAVKNADGKTYTIYEKASNKFLEKITGAQSSGVAADQAARMGDFGGAAETALVATSTTYDAVAGRFGMGQQAGTMTIANNGQGSGLWVTPVYKSHESDGFDADGLGYGSDITLYGVALGGDVTLANGVRVGAMFNVGSGDADGQGAASVVSNDFDYFGGSIYAGYAIDNFSIVGDVSYTTIDSDVEANTAAGKTSTSFDTTALSVGVTGQYALKVAEMDVTPHAGMRFTRIDMDDYTIESADFGEVGQYNASSANVFSIPVGVTISKEYVTDTWTVKPSFDLTLTGNFGDDTVDGTVSWTGVSNWDVSTKAEFVDNFTYGAAVGIAAKTGNFGLGLGLNYTGSSNTDEFGVNANARYMF